MKEWTFAESNPSDELAQLHFFSMKKGQETGEIEFRITVKEFAHPENQAMRFFAEADRQTNQKTAPFTPCGWGDTLLTAESAGRVHPERAPLSVRGQELVAG